MAGNENTLGGGTSAWAPGPKVMGRLETKGVDEMAFFGRREPCGYERNLLDITRDKMEDILHFKRDGEEVKDGR